MLRLAQRLAHQTFEPFRKFPRVLVVDSELDEDEIRPVTQQVGCARNAA